MFLASITAPTTTKVTLRINSVILVGGGFNSSTIKVLGSLYVLSTFAWNVYTPRCDAWNPVMLNVPLLYRFFLIVLGILRGFLLKEVFASKI